MASYSRWKKAELVAEVERLTAELANQDESPEPPDIGSVTTEVEGLLARADDFGRAQAAICLALAKQIDSAYNPKLNEIAAATKELRAALKEIGADDVDSEFFDDLELPGLKAV